MSDWYEPPDWEPTPSLRFVWRLEMINQHTGRKVRVLQQLWRIDSTVQREEWRDVPLVEEE